MIPLVLGPSNSAFVVKKIRTKKPTSVNVAWRGLQLPMRPLVSPKSDVKALFIDFVLFTLTIDDIWPLHFEPLFHQLRRIRFETKQNRRVQRALIAL